MRKLSCLKFLAIFVGFFSVAISAQTPAVRLQSFLSGLSSPVFITNAGDGSNRLFVVEKGGIIKVVQPNATTTTDFLNISSRVSTDGERGLLGLAFHPQYASNRRFFVYYTRASDGDIQIAEYQASAANRNVADTTEKIIITIDHSANNNHNGGTIAFGADDYLYAGTGDGGSGNDPLNNAQNINQLLGKFIRLNIDPLSSTAPYTSPSDNPFVGVNGADEIYAVGMRNPYRWSFDRGGTRQLWAADVGQGALEEVDIIVRGGNYGWRVYEGTLCTNLDPGLCNLANFIAPIFEYSNAGSPRCAITGGYVYRGDFGILPNGAYIYGDYCTGEILMWSGGQQTLVEDTTRNISSFGEDEDGELYVVGLGGTVEKIVSDAPTAATVTVGGRVMTASGRGIRNVVVTMTDSSGNVRTATSTSFGYYRFSDVAAGETYIFTAQGKRFTFKKDSRVRSIVEDTDDINFVASSF